MSYLLENGIEPSKILLLTFTRKAAKEMLSRAGILLKQNSVEKVVGGTFHSFANHILRQYAPFIGNKAKIFTIIDTVDFKKILSHLIKIRR